MRRVYTKRNTQPPGQTPEVTLSTDSHPTHLRDAVGSRTRGTKRIKWTRDMNFDVIRSFYRINKCDDTPLPGYRHQLFHEFTKLYPHLQLTEQNVVDRRSVIIKKRLYHKTRDR